MKRFSMMVAAALLAALSMRGFAASDSHSVDNATKALQEIIDRLGDEDYNERQKAFRDLQTIFSKQALAIASVKDTETLASLVPVLTFNDSLMRWLKEVMALPEAARNAQIAYASTPEAMPILTKVFNPDAAQRIDAAKLLAKLDGPGPDVLLARLIADDDRGVELAAMEAAWDRKPTQPVIDVLWDRAVLASFADPNYGAAASAQAFSFRGQPVMPVYMGSSRNRSMDGDVATSVLEHLQSPLVNAKLETLFHKAAEAIGAANDANAAPGRVTRESSMYSGMSVPMRNAYRLVSAYKPNDLVPSLYILASAKTSQRYNYIMNGTHLYYTNRTAAIANLLILIGQKSDTLKQTDLPGLMGSSLWMASGEDDEKNASDQIQTWWQTHAKDYGLTPSPAETQPTTQPDGAKK